MKTKPQKNPSSTKEGTGVAVGKTAPWQAVEEFCATPNDTNYDSMLTALGAHEYMLIDFNLQGSNIHQREKAIIVTFDCSKGVGHCQANKDMCKKKPDLILCYVARTPPRLFPCCSECITDAYGHKWKGKKDIIELKCYNDLDKQPDCKQPLCVGNYLESLEDFVTAMNETCNTVRKSRRNKDCTDTIMTEEGRNYMDMTDVANNEQDGVDIMDTTPELLEEDGIENVGMDNFLDPFEEDDEDDDIVNGLANVDISRPTTSDATTSDAQPGVINQLGGGGSNESNNEGSTSNDHGSQLPDGQNNQVESSGDSSLDASKDQEPATKTKDDDTVFVIVYDGAEQKEVLKLKCTDSVSMLTNGLNIKFDYLTLNNPKGNGWCDIHPETTVGEIANMTVDEENVIKATTRVVNWTPDLSTDNATDASDNGVAMIRLLQQQFDCLYKEATSFKNNCFLANSNKGTLLRLYTSVRTHAMNSCAQIELHEQSPTNLAIYFFDLAAAISKVSSRPFYSNDHHVAFAKGWKSVLDTYIFSSCTVNNSSPVAVDNSPPVKKTKTGAKKTTKLGAPKDVPSNVDKKGQCYIHHGTYPCGGCGGIVTAVTKFELTLDGCKHVCTRGIVRINPTVDGTFRGNFKGNLPKDWADHPLEYMFTELGMFISKKKVNTYGVSLSESNKYLLRLLLSPFHSFLQLYLRRYDYSNITESLPIMIIDVVSQINDLVSTTEGTTEGTTEATIVKGVRYTLVMSKIFMILGALLNTHWEYFAGDAWSQTNRNYLKDKDVFTTSLVCKDDDENKFYCKGDNINKFYSELQDKLVDSKQIKAHLKNIFGKMSVAMQTKSDSMKANISAPEMGMNEEGMVDFIVQNLMQLLYHEVKNMWTEDGKEVLRDNTTIVQKAEKYAKDISTTIATMMFKHMNEWISMIDEATEDTN